MPKRRFPGFTDDWELRKLGECFTERNEALLNGELLSVTINEGIKKFSDLNRHDNSNQDKSKYKKVCIGDIAYNSMRMWQGASGYSKYEGIVSPAYTVLSPKENICSECLAYQFKLPTIKHKFQINSQGITSDNWVLKFPTLSEIGIFVSNSKEEQIKIASFFSTLDQHITLHQRKLDTLKEQKMTYLKLLFPAKGQTKPALRFQGFEDDWEEVKLGEVLEERNVQQLPQEDTPLVSFTVENGVTPKTDRYDREFLVRTGDKKYKYTELDDIVYNPANLKFGAISRNKFGKAVFSPIYVTLVVNKSKVFANFIEGIVTKRDFIQEALQFQEGTV
ncbi:TPA: restriction endonuclease subunit S, partial [Streptococcus suis]|nr:restriction endonuclease subunit S [Streptococcus suis]